MLQRLDRTTARKVRHALRRTLAVGGLAGATAVIGGIILFA